MSMLQDVFSSRGLSFIKKKVLIKNSTGGSVAKGDLLQFDLLMLSSGATNFKDGSENSGWFHVVNPGATLRGYAYYCVAEKDMLALDIAEAWIYHPAILVNSDSAGQIRVASGAGTTDSGRSLKFGAADIGAKAIAIPHVATSLGLSMVHFNGIEGCGIQKA